MGHVSFVIDVGGLGRQRKQTGSLCLDIPSHPACAVEVTAPNR